MEYLLSDFGKKLCGPSGINQLMDDLGKPFPKNLRIVQMGGGNPARISDVEQMYRIQMENIMSKSDYFENLIGHYDSPQGRTEFINAIAKYFKDTYGWNIEPDNIAITNGSQSAFFYLFNMFSGNFTDKNGKIEKKKIVLPLVPEYVGYADQCIQENCFVGIPSTFQMENDNIFKYHVNFEILEEYLNNHNDTAALCVTRPTNPTGNVLTDSEIKKLSELSKKYNIPLFIDNAYGLPWPNIIFTDDAKPCWDTNIILSMSLSKIGLPSLRTGIIIADKKIINAISKINAIASLASGSIGQALTTQLISSGQLIEIAKQKVKPFYLERSQLIQSYIHKYFSGTNYAIHKCEGSIFVWLLLPDLNISTIEFYNVLKEQGLFVMPGEYFFFGEMADDSLPTLSEHPHYNKCLRLNYARPAEELDYGIKLLAQSYKQHGGL